MATPIVTTETEPTQFVNSTSRYADSEVILYGEQSIITFKTYKKTTIPENADDRFLVIPQGEEFRPDKTSRRAYGTVNLWWKIMQANNISDIYDYRAGKNIRIPSSFGLLT